jgi:hypothetical protein
MRRRVRRCLRPGPQTAAENAGLLVNQVPDDFGVALEAQVVLDRQELGQLAAAKECVNP